MPEGAPLPYVAETIIERFLQDVLHLISAPRLYWVALVLLLVLQAFAGVAWTAGEPNRDRWKSVKKGVGTGLKTAVVLVSVNIGGNAVPVLTWTIPVVWSGAIWLTVREIGRSATTAESQLRKLLDSVWEEIRARNRLSMAGETGAAAVASDVPAGVPEPAVPSVYDPAAPVLPYPSPEPVDPVAPAVGSDPTQPPR